MLSWPYHCSMLQLTYRTPTYSLCYHLISWEDNARLCSHALSQETLSLKIWHRQKSCLFSPRLRGGNWGKWGMPPAPTSFIAGWRGLGMKECQATVGHVVCVHCCVMQIHFPVMDRFALVHQILLVLQSFKSLLLRCKFWVQQPASPSFSKLVIPIFSVLSQRINKIKSMCKTRSKCRTTENIFNRKVMKCHPLI